MAAAAFMAVGLLISAPAVGGSDSHAETSSKPPHASGTDAHQAKDAGKDSHKAKQGKRQDKRASKKKKDAAEKKKSHHDKADEKGAQKFSAGTAEDPKHVEKGAAFEVDRTVVWLGGTQVIPFKVKKAGRVDRRFPVSVGHGDGLEVIAPPVVLAKHQLGFLRVRGLRSGSATLRVGDASLDVRVKDATMHRELVWPTPTIISPAAHAVVWGKIAVAVELLDDSLEQRIGGGAAKVTLRLPDGKRLGPVHTTGPVQGPMRRFTFVLDASQLKPGTVELTAVAERPGHSPQHSKKLSLRVVRADGARLKQGEAEALRDVKRPDRYIRRKRREKAKELGKPVEQRPLRVRPDKDASGEKYVRSYPPLTIPVDVKKDGWYQLMLRVSGRAAGGALPTVGVRVDDQFAPVTTARLAGEQWRRLPVGHPIRLKAGDHKLIAYFENHFNARHVKARNVRFDRYELLRLDDRPNGAAAMSASAQRRPLSIVMDQNLRGQTLGGEVTITGTVHRPKGAAGGPPTVRMLVNGKAVQSQRSRSPRFVLGRGTFSEGLNTVQLEARMKSGLSARSPKQKVRMSSFDGPDPGAQQFLRFAAVDPAWGKAFDGKLKHRRGYDGTTAYFKHGKEATVELPVELTGKFTVRVEADPKNHHERPDARVTLLEGNGGKKEKKNKKKDEENKATKQVVGEKQIRPRYQPSRIGVFDAHKGPKRLKITFTSDDGGKNGKKAKHQRNTRAFFAALDLKETGDQDHQDPTAKIVYPAASEKLYGVDAVVADVADDQAVAWAQLMVDGKPTDVRLKPNHGKSQLVLPLVLRDMSPGTHHVSVRVRDQAGNTAHSPRREVRVLKDRPDKLTQYQRAVRLLDRFGYGPQPDQLADVLTMGEQAYLKDRLYRTWDDPGEQTAWAQALADYPDDKRGHDVVCRAVAYAAASPDPVRARFVMWLANHFTTWMRKIKPQKQAQVFERLARVGPAPFFDLLMTSATTPGMVYYLDQRRSFGRRINENYAREVMELHSVGVNAGYTQADVTKLSYILTGWTAAEEAPRDGGGGRRLNGVFRYAPEVNDPAAKTVFGMRFHAAKDPAKRYDRVREVFEMLAARPQAAHFISRQLVEQYLADPAPDAVVDKLAKVYLRSGGDLREVLLALARQPAFWAPDADTRLSHPLGFALHLSRAAHQNRPNWIAGYLGRSAVGLFDHEQPNGYPAEDEAYTDSNATLQRWRFAAMMGGPLVQRVPAPLRAPQKDEDAANWRQRLIDFIAVRLTGEQLGPKSNKAAQKLLERTKLTGWQRVKFIAGFIAQLPETGLR